jgi:hypothetical protein
MDKDKSLLKQGLNLRKTRQFLTHTSQRILDLTGEANLMEEQAYDLTIKLKKIQYYMCLKDEFCN